MRRFFNQTWVRLSLASSLFVLMGVILVGVASVVLSQSDIFATLLRNRLLAENSLVDQLAESYRTHNGWSGLDSVMKNFSTMIIVPGPGGDQTVVVADEGGTVLYGGQFDTELKRLSASDRAEAIAVMVDGRVRGYVHLVRMPRPFTDVPENIQGLVINEVSRVLLIFAVGIGVVGLFAGTLLSRGLTAPLNELADTARAFGSKNFGKRTRVHGSEEVVLLTGAFNQMADALEQAETLRRNLVADVAHELRTPLTVLQANLQAIQDGIYPADQTELQKLIEQTELLSHLVNDLHEMAQLDSKQLPLYREIITISTLISSTACKFEAVAAQHSVNVSLQLSSQEPVYIDADINRIQQVINNLLQNALTHTPEGGSITLSLAQTAGQVHIAVEDTGDGIPSNDLPHIFERFYRVDRSRSRSSGGAGLGLAIVKGIVEAHGGKVTVTSEGLPGRGARFIVTLPLAPAPVSS